MVCLAPFLLQKCMLYLFLIFSLEGQVGDHVDKDHIWLCTASPETAVLCYFENLRDPFCVVKVLAS